MSSLSSLSSSSFTGLSFSQALSHALKMLGTPGLLLKEELSTLFTMPRTFWFGKSVCFQTLPFVFDYKLGLVKKSASLL